MFYRLGGFCFAKTGYSPFAHAHPLPSLRSVQWTATQGLLSLPQKKCKPPVLLEKIAMKSLKTPYFDVTNAKYSNKPYCSTKIRV